MIAHQIPMYVGKTPGVKSELGCSWWNLACQGGQQVANSGLSAITKSIANGANMLLGEIVKTIDESTTVPLADPTYRHVYTGFLGLAAPLIGVILLIAVVLAAMRRDAGTLGRAIVGIGVASLGGALYIVFAQLLVGLDDWLAHGIVRVTGNDLTNAMTDLASGFEAHRGHDRRDGGQHAASLLMFIMLVAALILWFVLVLRKIAILVVVAFAPLLIAGYLWAPTRGWVRKATEVLVALVFTKSAIFALFGIGLALLSRGSGQSLSDFVGATVLDVRRLLRPTGDAAAGPLRCGHPPRRGHDGHPARRGTARHQPDADTVRPYATAARTWPVPRLRARARSCRIGRPRRAASTRPRTGSCSRSGGGRRQRRRPARHPDRKGPRSRATHRHPEPPPSPRSRSDEPDPG